MQVGRPRKHTVSGSLSCLDHLSRKESYYDGDRRCDGPRQLHLAQDGSKRLKTDTLNRKGHKNCKISEEPRCKTFDVDQVVRLEIWTRSAERWTDVKKGKST
jgi:hypothetical protein